MKKIFNRNAKNLKDNYYRIFDRYASEKTGYQNVVNKEQFGDTINNFLNSNRLDSVVHIDLFPNKNGGQGIITLIGSNQIMQLNESLYNFYKLEIEGKLSEAMNYEVIKNLISYDTEVILNFCSDGIVYSDNKHDKIAKLYIYIGNVNSTDLMSQILKKLLSDKTSPVVVNYIMGQKVKVTCGEEYLLINSMMYGHISSDIFEHNRNVEKQKFLIKK